MEASEDTTKVEGTEPESPGPGLTGAMQNLRAQQQKHLDEGQGRIAEDVAYELAYEELKRRCGLLVKAFKDHKEASKEHQKIKPDLKAFDSMGKLTSESFSQDQANKLKAAREKVTKLEKAIEAAIVQGDYSKLS